MMKSERGMILMSVLWIVFILSMVGFMLATAVRAEMATAQNSFDSERALFMAKGAAESFFYALSHKQDITKDSDVRAEKDVYIFPFDDGEARVRYESTGGKIDLNAAPDLLLASMFDSVGIDRQTRNQLVDSILDWRDADDITHLYGAEVDAYPENESRPAGFALPPNRPFETEDELLYVRNMTADIYYGRIVVGTDGNYRRIPGIRDLVTVTSGSDKVSAKLASADVLIALPGMDAEMAARLIAERDIKPFSDADDLAQRIPEMFRRDAVPFLSFGGDTPTLLVSTATIAGSGTTRSVRANYSHIQKLQFLSFMPLAYKRIDEVHLSRWQFQ